MDKLINEIEQEAYKYLQFEKKSTGWEKSYYAGQVAAYTKVVVKLKAFNEHKKKDNTLWVIDNIQN